jgi:hypothetical protein
MSAYRDVFCRTAGFDHVSRCISGLLLSENKTLQAIAAQQMMADLLRQGRYADEVMELLAQGKGQIDPKPRVGGGHDSCKNQPFT